MSNLRFISFFAGIGGIDLGLERAGHTCVGQVEIDDFCQRVLAKHWPDVPRWGDIRELTGDELPEADLWAGGFPCQDISNAGKRAGIRGERSGLFFDWMRLVRKVRPRFLLLENVAALLNRGLQPVLQTLAEGGYDAEWRCIPAATLGAPHIRDRLFLLAYAEQDGWDPDTVLGVSGALGRAVDQACQEGCPQAVEPIRCGSVLPYWADPSEPGAHEASDRHMVAARRLLGTGWHAEPNMGRVVDGLPTGMDRVRALGNAVVPQVAEFIGRCLMEAT